MRNFIILVNVVLLLTLTHSNAQNLAYNQGDKLLNIGTSFLNSHPTNAFNANRRISIPPIMASFELGFHEYVSAGFYVGYANTRWRRDIGNADIIFPINAIGGGARVSFHFWGLLADALNENLSQDVIDMYLTISSGIYISANSDPTLDPSPRYNFRPDNLIGGALGIRYYFKPKMAVYLETGRMFTSFSNVGLSFKF